MNGNKGFGYLQFHLWAIKDLGLSDSLVVTKDLGLSNSLAVTKDLDISNSLVVNKGFGSLQFIGGNKGFGFLQFIGGNKGFGSLMVRNNLGLSHSFMVNKEDSPNLFFPLAKEILIYVALIIMADTFSFLSLSLSLSLSRAPARWIII